MKEILARVREIEIKVRRKVVSTFAGAYRSAFRGSGLEFEEVRAYQYGDDVRSIDWNVSAKNPSGQLFVKVFREERELNVFLLLDVSGSQEFGPAHERKMQIATELAAVLAFSAQTNNDKFGLVAFSDRVELYCKPAKGRRQVLSLISRILRLSQPGAHRQRGTNLRAALEFFRRTQKRRSVLFVLSDFIDENYEKQLVLLSRKHEVTLIRLFHPEERITANLGIVPVQDAETGGVSWVFSSNPQFRQQLAEAFDRIEGRMLFLNRKYGIGYLPINTTEDHLEALERYFFSRSAGGRRAG